MLTFDEKLDSVGQFPLFSDRVDTLQVNVGKKCNQSCKHCHVEAGPHRNEVMSRETIDTILRVLETYDIPTVDITGGAPEMNPHFEHLVEGAAGLRRRVLVRSNLTVHLEPGKEHLLQLLAMHKVHIIASLPCYLEKNIDAQRGNGVAEKSIQVLRRLNQLGYGKPESGRVLNLVYNPPGPTLPPSQEALQSDYRRELAERYGVRFNHLYTLTNVPIGRFKKTLSTNGRLDQYLQKLEDAFNPAVADTLMCRNLVSIGWDGTIYDCDFNQILSLPVATDASRTIGEFDPNLLTRRRIVTGDHCYACTAGAGSSCGGALD